MFNTRRQEKEADIDEKVIITFRGFTAIFDCKIQIQNNELVIYFCLPPQRGAGNLVMPCVRPSVRLVRALANLFLIELDNIYTIPLNQ